MNPYRIEIVRRANGRFAWIFVRVDDRGRRVLARSERSYGSRKRVCQAIEALVDAQVVDLTKGYQPVLLPATSFALVPGVMPLVFGESPFEERAPARKVRAVKAVEKGEPATPAEPAEAVGAGQGHQAGRGRRKAT